MGAAQRTILRRNAFYKNEESVVCQTTTTTTTTGRCIFSAIHKRTYIGGCSRGCLGWPGHDSLDTCKEECQKEPSCGGCTYEYGQWELRSGPTLGVTPWNKNEESVVCQTTTTTTTTGRCIFSAIHKR